MGKRITLTGVLETMDEKAEGDKLTLGAVVDSLGTRGYGPLLLAPVLIDILPTGGVPGIPTLVAATVIIFAVQMILGRASPWMPNKLRSKGFARSKFDKARNKVTPVTEKIDLLIKPRLSFLTTPAAARVVGVICILMALTMPPLEVIPLAGGGYLSAVVIALLAVGLSGHDGLIILLGLILAVVGVIAAASWLVL